MKRQFEHGRVHTMTIQPPGQIRKLPRVGAFAVPAVKKDHCRSALPIRSRFKKPAMDHAVGGPRCGALRFEREVARVLKLKVARRLNQIVEKIRFSQQLLGFTFVMVAMPGNDR